jgi:hypothetical protein
MYSSKHVGMCYLRFFMVEKPDWLTEGRAFFSFSQGVVNQSFLLLDRTGKTGYRGTGRFPQFLKP